MRALPLAKGKMRRDARWFYQERMLIVFIFTRGMIVLSAAPKVIVHLLVVATAVVAEVVVMVVEEEAEPAAAWLKTLTSRKSVGSEACNAFNAR